jgi:hypothetical protein
MRHAPGEAAPALQRTRSWWQLFGNGQSPGGPYRPAQVLNSAVGPLSITFASPQAATLTLTDGRRIPLVRQAF